MAPCNNCIYGGVQVGRLGEVIQQFKTAEKVVGAVWKTINYENDEIGCRMTAFQSKEEVCINNSFSEYSPHRMFTC